jgi:nucleoside-diphosphate-sugar epimerase
MTIVVIGASSGPGRMLFERLRDEDREIVGIARNQRGLETTDHARFVSLDAADSHALAETISAEDTVIHCSRPEFVTGLLHLKPEFERLIAIGSTRIYTRFPDDKCARLAAMSHAIWMSDLPATILHPTMIYGAPGLNNIERVMTIARRAPFIPLPLGGSSLIQPVHASDVVSAIVACLDDSETTAHTMIIPGGAPLTYRQFVEACIEAADTHSRVVSLPYWLMSTLGWITQFTPFIPAITQDEIRRLLEDKAYDVDDACNLLGGEPMDFQTGLSRLKLT